MIVCALVIICRSNEFEQYDTTQDVMQKGWTFVKEVNGKTVKIKIILCPIDRPDLVLRLYSIHLLKFIVKLGQLNS